MCGGAFTACNEKWILGNRNGGEPQLCSLNDGGTPTDKGDDTWTYYSTNDGLMNYQVTAIVAAPNADLWVGTGSGLQYLELDR